MEMLGGANSPGGKRFRYIPSPGQPAGSVGERFSDERRAAPPQSIEEEFRAPPGFNSDNGALGGEVRRPPSRTFPPQQTGDFRGYSATGDGPGSSEQYELSKGLWGIPSGSASQAVTRGPPDFDGGAGMDMGLSRGSSGVRRTLDSTWEDHNTREQSQVSECKHTIS